MSKNTTYNFLMAWLPTRKNKDGSISSPSDHFNPVEVAIKELISHNKTDKNGIDAVIYLASQYVNKETQDYELLMKHSDALTNTFQFMNRPEKVDIIKLVDECNDKLQHEYPSLDYPLSLDEANKKDYAFDKILKIILPIKFKTTTGITDEQTIYNALEPILPHILSTDENVSINLHIFISGASAMRTTWLLVQLTNAFKVSQEDGVNIEYWNNQKFYDRESKVLTKYVKKAFAINRHKFIQAQGAMEDMGEENFSYLPDKFKNTSQTEAVKIFKLDLIDYHLNYSDNDKNKVAEELDISAKTVSNHMRDKQGKQE